MTIAQMLFSFEGRLRRRDFWLCTLALMVVHWLLNSVVSAMVFTPMPVMAMGPGGFVTMWSGWWARVGPAYSLIWVVLLWPRLAIGVKRCHDRNKTGLWLLLALIPILGWIWLLIDLGFLDGTPGPNQYGPSPKGLGVPAEA